MTATRRRRKGSALVEFALVSPVLLLLLAGVLNYASALRTATSVANAARLGAEYAGLGPANASDTAGIQSAAINSTPGVTGLAVTSARTCQCPGGTPVNCTGSCPGGKMLVYVRVTARATAASIFTYTGLGFSGATSSQATVRVQ